MVEFRLQLRNSRTVTVKLRLEPWGEEYAFAGGAVVELRAHGPDAGSLEIDSDDRSITIYGWSGSVVELFHSGAPLSGSGIIAG
jgi:hypothetical protein